MQSQAKDVDSYLLEAGPERRESLTRLRDLCREILVGYEEGMEYGMPGYKNDGKGEVGFANQKQYISLYILEEDVIEKNRPALNGLSVGKCCIRYTTARKMDWDVIRKLLYNSVKSAEKPGYTAAWNPRPLIITVLIVSYQVGNDQRSNQC